MHGFDEFFGNLYHLNAEEEPENIDYPKNPEFRKKFGPRGVIHAWAEPGGTQKIVDTGSLTKKRMETVDGETLAAAKSFIQNQHKAGKPFFVWWNATRMHFRTHVEAEHRGISGQDEYSDGMVEHDMQVGELLKALDDLGIANDTIVFYSTDNGPHYNTWPDAGTTPFRGEKNSNWEGAFRVPAFVRWPGHFSAGVTLNGIVAHEDWLPTFAATAGEANIKAKLLQGVSLNGRTYRNHIDGFNQLAGGEKALLEPAGRRQHPTPAEETLVEGQAAERLHHRLAAHGEKRLREGERVYKWQADDGRPERRKPARGSVMNMLSRRQFLRTSGPVVGAAMVPSLLVPGRARAAGKELIPRKLPFPPNDEFGSYEPTITPDGNTIYFARFAANGDKRVRGTTTDIFVTRRIRQTGEWPGTGADWTPPERLPDTVNSDSIDQEPRITPDGKTLYFMSRRSGNADIWVTQQQPNGEWTPAQPLPASVNSSHTDHCFMPFNLPGEPETSVFISVRPREAGASPTADLYTTRMEKGVWQPAKRYESKLLDSISQKCRLNVVSRDGLVLGVVSVHDFGKFHTMLFVHYDPTSKQWKGPIVEAPFNNAAIDGACPMFTAGGDKMIWSAGYDRGPGPVSTAGGTGGRYDLFWLNTSDIVAYYKANAKLG